MRFSRRPLDTPTPLRIDPGVVETTLTHYPSGRDGHYPFGVFGGNWDRERTPLSSLSLYRSLRERFETGVPWAETDAYRDARRQIEYGAIGLKGARTVVELDERCREVDRLYEAIEREGYRSQTSLADRPSESVPAYGASRQDPRIPDELKLAIGRDGELTGVPAANTVSRSPTRSTSRPSPRSSSCATSAGRRCARKSKAHARRQC